MLKFVVDRGGVIIDIPHKNYSKTAYLSLSKICQIWEHLVKLSLYRIFDNQSSKFFLLLVFSLNKLDF